MVERIKGQVKFFNSEKGFGFIAPESGGKDVFVHKTALPRGVETLRENQKVSFVIVDSDRRGTGDGKKAAEIQLVG